jgi:hypothetical protein
MVVSGWTLIKIRRVTGKSCRENQNTILCSVIFSPENYASYEVVWKNMVATDDSMTHAHCMLDNQRYKHTSSLWQQWLRERASVLTLYVHWLSCIYFLSGIRNSSCGSIFGLWMHYSAVFERSWTENAVQWAAQYNMSNSHRHVTVRSSMVTIRTSCGNAKNLCISPTHCMTFLVTAAVKICYLPKQRESFCLSDGHGLCFLTWELKFRVDFRRTPIFWTVLRTASSIRFRGANAMVIPKVHASLRSSHAGIKYWH